MRPTLRVHGNRTALLVTLACALTVTAQPPAHAEPKTLSEVHDELKSLYHDAEVATDKYNAANEKVKKQEKRVATLKAQVKAADKKLSKLSATAGAAARAQYRGGGLPVEVQVTVASDPRHALDNATRAHQAEQTTLNVLKALTKTREERSDSADKASDELETLTKTRQTRKTETDKIKKRIKAAKKIESGLAARQRAQLADLEKQEVKEAQAKWLDSGVLDHIGTEASKTGRKAIAFATAQLGKPYVWGATGPGSFDCSGLTSAAWRAAGVTIPRTSQAQWAGLKHVPVDSMRPGDLIIYFADASHVALYIGDGEVIEAPRPGRDVKVAPAGSMEILGAVRPDA